MNVGRLDPREAGPNATPVRIIVLMLYGMFLKRVFRLIYGPLPEPAPAERTTGLVLVADGIGGFDLCVTGMKYAAAWAGLPHRLEFVDWGHGFFRWYKDLSNVPNQLAQAKAVAQEVLAFRERNPDVPVYLVGKSGGTGIMVRALEILPEHSIEAVVLIASALSPTYDLSRALRAVRRDLTLFWSPLDLILLGAGTSIFGTINRVRSPGAGMVGFRQPPGADPEQYAKLRQVRWSPRMYGCGHLGGHLGSDNPLFLRAHVIPLLLDGTELREAATAESSSAHPTPIT